MYQIPVWDQYDRTCQQGSQCSFQCIFGNPSSRTFISGVFINWETHLFLTANIYSNGYTHITVANFCQKVVELAFCVSRTCQRSSSRCSHVFCSWFKIRPQLQETVSRTIFNIAHFLGAGKRTDFHVMLEYMSTLFQKGWGSSRCFHGFLLLI